MSQWPTKPLGTLATDLQPGFASRPDGDADGALHLRPLNMTEDGTIVDKGTKRVSCTPGQLKRYNLIPGDVLFNNTNSPALVGKVAVFRLNGTFVFSNHLTRIRVHRNQLVPDFLQKYLFLLWSDGYFRQQCTQWINQAAINVNALSELPIPVPSLSEQDRVVRILDEVETLRGLRSLADGRMEAVGPALFHEMFDSPSKDWPKDTFANLGSLDRGKSRHRPRDEPSLFGGPYPFIQTGDVANSSGNITTFSQTYSELGLAQSRLWPAGTLCITIAANIAKTGVLSFDACFPDSVVGFTPNNRVRVGFIQFWLRTLQGQLEQEAPQAAQKNINLQTLRELELAVPPVSLQDEFVDRVAKIRELRTPQMAARQRLDDLFQCVLRRSFQGGL